jgi:hypothetical protein
MGNQGPVWQGGEAWSRVKEDGDRRFSPTGQRDLALRLSQTILNYDIVSHPLSPR